MHFRFSIEIMNEKVRNWKNKKIRKMWIGLRKKLKSVLLDKIN